MIGYQGRLSLMQTASELLGSKSAKEPLKIDFVLLYATIALTLLGLVMVSSASISVADKNISSPFYYLYRQCLSLTIGVVLAFLVYRVRLVYWERSGLVLLGIAIFLLLLVLIPGVGKTVNGSTRWIPLGLFNLQVSEVVKLCLLIYVAGYLVRYREQVQTTLWGFLKPMMLVGLAGLLLLLEPDFGAAVVLAGTVLGMMFLGGVRFTQFMTLVLIVSVAGVMLIVSSPYRLERLTTFLNPWADPFDSGFQLTQSLIAIGSGGWSGVGLGGSVQKLFYLPESHTDFVFAVLAEELGLVGVSVVIILYSILIIRAFAIGRDAEQYGNRFAAYLAWGIGIWLGFQAVINMGVNMGLLPTKGLTLPLMSYGGSSLIVTCIAIALLLRIYKECGKCDQQAVIRKSARRRGYQ